jgi:tyrosyl-tRNA synthetase
MSMDAADPTTSAPASGDPIAPGAASSPDPTDVVPPAVLDAYRRLTSGIAAELPEGALLGKLAQAHREGRPLRVKLGIDPTGSDLTLGHAVVLRLLRRFQDLGHVAVLIVGDVTGMVGDPSGRSVTRTMQTSDQAAENARSYFEQLMRILDPDRVEVVRNSDWLGTMTFPEVLREASHVTVARLLERDDFARRFRDGLPLSLVELMYPLLQGLDSVAVRADIELGGTDQTFNNLMGRELQRAHGQAPQVVVTVPLLEGLDGSEKMSKSLGNYVAINEPAAEQFGKLMSIQDRMVDRYARLCTDLSPEQCDALAEAANAGGPAANRAKRALAAAVVALYHGPAAAVEAEERFDAQFRRKEIPSDAPAHALPEGDTVHLPALLRAAGLAASTSAARRSITEGAVRLDGEPVPTGTLDLGRDALVGRVLQLGRRKSVRLTG